jgi:hypothetical protein
MCMHVASASVTHVTAMHACALPLPLLMYAAHHTQASTPIPHASKMHVHSCCGPAGVHGEWLRGASKRPWSGCVCAAACRRVRMQRMCDVASCCRCRLSGCTRGTSRCCCPTCWPRARACPCPWPLYCCAFCAALASQPPPTSSSMVRTPALPAACTACIALGALSAGAPLRRSGAHACGGRNCMHLCVRQGRRAPGACCACVRCGTLGCMCACPSMHARLCSENARMPQRVRACGAEEIDMASLAGLGLAQRAVAPEPTKVLLCGGTADDPCAPPHAKRVTTGAPLFGWRAASAW